MSGMASLGHVGRQTALEVTISQLRDFLQEGNAEMVLQVPAQASNAQEKRDFEDQDCAAEGQDRRERGNTLARQSQLRGNVEKTSEKECFDQHSATSSEERQQNASQAEGAACAEKLQYCSTRPERGFSQSSA